MHRRLFIDRRFNRCFLVFFSWPPQALLVYIGVSFVEVGGARPAPKNVFVGAGGGPVRTYKSFFQITQKMKIHDEIVKFLP